MSKHRTPRSAGTRAVVYVSISKDREGETSTTTQREEATAYAESKGWTVVEVCEDQGRSAYHNKARRPGFDRAMTLIERGAAD